MFRGIPFRHLLLLLLGPMLAETLSMLFATWYVYQATTVMDLGPRWTSLIPAGGSVAYAISSLIAGRWVTGRVAPYLMVAMLLLVTAFGFLGMVLYSFWGFVACAMLVSASIGHYYTPFQINMTHVQPFRTLAYSVAFYNIAWGTGAASGPYLTGWLTQSSLWALGGSVALLAVVHTTLNLLAWFAPPPDHEEAMTAAFASNARQRLSALVCFAAVGIVIRGLYLPLWPSLGDFRGWSSVQVGLGQFAMFLPVPLLALAWARIRRRLIKPWVMIGSMFAGLGGFAALYFTRSWPSAMVCVFFVGVMESCVVFHTIYYMNADPDVRRRARNVGIFEMFAGLTNVAGPLALGLLAWDDPTSWRPYLFGCAVITSVIVSITMLVTRPARLRESAGTSPAAK